LLLSQALPPSEHQETVAKLVDAAIALDNAPAYIEAMNSFGFMGEDSVIEGIRARNTSKLSKIEADIMDAKENLGEEEVRQAMFAKATLLAESGDTKEAIAVFDEIEQQKKTTTGQKVDVSFSKLRIAFSTDDLPLMSKTIEKAKEYVEVGGDWERRNRLKVYEAVFFTRTRHFSQAAHMFLESVATFTAVELFEYPRFIKYAVATAVVALDRSTLKSKVIDSPEVIAVIHEVPHLQRFLNSIYECQYREFFDAALEINQSLLREPFFAPHARYFLRQARIVAYKQFTQAYCSIRLTSMAASFGVSPQFLDRDLSDLIYCGRLPCKIDAVKGIIESVRMDSHNSLYEQIIKDGDRLLNRIQKLSRVIAM